MAAVDVAVVVAVCYYLVDVDAVDVAVVFFAGLLLNKLVVVAAVVAAVVFCFCLCRSC